LWMCFAPNRGILSPHLKFQKWFLAFWLRHVLGATRACTFLSDLNFQKRSGAEVFCTCWLQNALCATAACNSWTCQLPKVLREWCVLYLSSWKCAFCHFAHLDLLLLTLSLLTLLFSSLLWLVSPLLCFCP
jgi:hypothetical protein